MQKVRALDVLVVAFSLIAALSGAYCAWGMWYQISHPTTAVIVTNLPGWRPEPPTGLSATVVYPHPHPNLIPICIAGFVIFASGAFILNRIRRRIQAKEHNELLKPSGEVLPHHQHRFTGRR